MYVIKIKIMDFFITSEIDIIKKYIFNINLI